jgi:hypothetical protein
VGAGFDAFSATIKIPALAQRFALASEVLKQ